MTSRINTVRTTNKYDFLISEANLLKTCLKINSRNFDCCIYYTTGSEQYATRIALYPKSTHSCSCFQNTKQRLVLAIAATSETFITTVFVGDLDSFEHNWLNESHLDNIYCIILTTVDSAEQTH